MPGPSWGPDSAADEAIIAANIARLLSDLVIQAPLRPQPAVTLAHDWHQRLYHGVRSVPTPSYLGRPRGSAHPDLVDYEVVLVDQRTGRVVAHGVPAAQVAAELAAFGQALHDVVSRFDRSIPVGGRPVDPAQLLGVVELAAVVHGEWVRVHPYANGNGRIARTWANWIATRYGLPPFVRIKPRPDGLLYGQAARRSMGTPPRFVGDHTLTVSLFVDLLRQRP